MNGDEVAGPQSNTSPKNRRPGLYLTLIGVAVLVVVAAVGLLIFNTTDDGKSPDDETASGSTNSQSKTADSLPTGVKVVEKGHTQGSDANGDRVATVGVVLANRSDFPIAIDVKFALWTSPDAEEPLWTSDDGDAGTQYVTIMPHGTVGLGDDATIKSDSAAPINVQQIKVSKKNLTSGQPDPQLADVVKDSPSSSMQATTVEIERGDFEEYSLVKFHVDNEYDEEIKDASIGVIYRDQESGDILGGWTKRPIASVNDRDIPDAIDDAYPGGKSTHVIGIRNLARAADDLELVEIYVWPESP